MILLIVCVVIAAVLFLVWGVSRINLENIIGVMLLRFGLTILTCFIHVHQMYHWTVIFCRYYCGINMGDCRNSWS